MFRVITNNWQLKLLALVLAAVFSSYIYRFGDYEMKTSLVLPLQVRNLAEDLAFLEKLPGQVTVNVTGNLRQLNSLRRMPLVAVLNLRSFTSPGMYTIAPELPDLPDLKVYGSVPTVRVRLAAKLKTTVPIQVWHVGELPKGYVLSKESIEPLRAEVVGPQEKVEQVKRVVAEVTMSDRISRFSQAVPLVAYSEDNEPLNGGVMKITPALASYRAEINPVANVKVVRVFAVLTGEPRAGYHVKEVRLTPSQVLFEDSLYEKHPLEVVNTETIDLTGHSSSFTKEAALDYGFAPPPGLPRKVSVQVVLAKHEADQASVLSLPVELLGQQEAFSYVVTPPSVSVQSSEFAELTGEELEKVRVRVSVLGMEPGVYRVIPEVVLPPGVERAAMKPESVEVKIEAGEE